MKSPSFMFGKNSRENGNKADDAIDLRETLLWFPTCL